MAMLEAMGSRLTHLHIADGTGLAKDEHLIPGRGDQPCVEVLERVAAQGYAGHVIVEVNTRRALDRAEREADLAEALAFCRLHLVAAPGAPTRGGPPHVVTKSCGRKKKKKNITATPSRPAQ